jgi:stearoyl-CoA desaturase (delta-9 desaturase)
MLLPDWAVLNAAIDWLAHGLWDLAWWQIVLYTLVTTHLTIMGVTIFLHRAQSHRALDLGPIPSHFFRFWLWLTTGMVTKEFVAIHRKHHAKVETEEDPHSPQTRGLKKLLLKAPSCTAQSPRTWRPWPSTATARPTTGSSATCTPAIPGRVWA